MSDRPIWSEPLPRDKDKPPPAPRTGARLALEILVPLATVAVVIAALNVL
jgi:hypothetical protein